MTYSSIIVSLICFLSIELILQVQGQACGLSKLSRASARIVGGQRASSGEFPWQVSLQAFGTHFCGGTILNEEYIITAGHCAVAVNKRRLKIVVGELDLERFIPSLEGDREQTFDVDKVTVHEKFDRRTLRYDMAVVKLKGKINFGRNVARICLPPQGFEFPGKIGVVSGWGKLTENAARSTNYLNKVSLPILTNRRCQRMYDNPNSGQTVTIRPEWICAGYSEGQRDACQGDSGGPMVTNLNGRWYISGIVSGGFGCARKNNPGIFTNIADFTNWINRQVSGGRSLTRRKSTVRSSRPKFFLNGEEIDFKVSG